MNRNKCRHWVVKMAYEYDWNGSEQALLQAIKLIPGLCSVHHYYAWHKLSVGKIDEAILEMRRALELDPLSKPVTSFMGFSYISQKRYFFRRCSYRGCMRGWARSKWP